MKDADKYLFHPRRLLAEIASTFIHFAPHAEFVLATVRDERSYDQERLALQGRRIWWPSEGHHRP